MLKLLEVDADDDAKIVEPDSSSVDSPSAPPLVLESPGMPGMPGIPGIEGGVSLAAAELLVSVIVVPPVG